MNLKIIVSLYILCSVYGEEHFHHVLNDHEIKTIFHRKRETMNQVDYQVVELQHELKSSTPTVHISTLDQNYTLYLEENDVLLGEKTPIIMASCDSNGNNIKYNVDSYFDLSNVKFYHDRKKRAALVVQEDIEGKIKINGVIGQNLVVRSLPDRVQGQFFHGKHHVLINSNEKVKYRTSIVQNSGDSFPTGLKNWFNLGSNFLNQVFTSTTQAPIKNEKINKKQVRKPEATVNLPSKKALNSVNPKKSINNINSVDLNENDVLYVQLLITIDSATLETHGNNLISLKKYMAAFWNAVDLRYRAITNPKIRLNIAGLLIPKNPVCASYFDKNLDKSGNFLVVNDALENMSDHFYQNPFSQNIQPPTNIEYDLVVGMTSKSLNSENEKDLEGLAYTDTICNHVTLKSRKMGSTIIEDKGAFKGITVAAHEIGHVFGLHHDDEPSNEISQSYEEVCNDDDDSMKYLMHSLTGGFYWSKCSIKALQKKLSDDSIICLKNKPIIGNSFNKILPGKVMSRDEQCKKLVIGYEAYTGNKPEYTNNKCTQLVCAKYNPNGSIKYRILGPPADGTDCDHGKICLDGQCVQDIDPSKKNLPPPKPVTRDEQCLKYTGFPAYTGGEIQYTRDCKSLTCYSSAEEKFIFPPETPKEGTDCGFGEICKLGECIVNPDVLNGKIPAPKVKTREELCRKFNYLPYTSQDSNQIIQSDQSCSKLQCEKIKQEKKYIVTIGDAVEEGTECNSGKICHDNKCVFFSDLFGKNSVV